MNADQIELIILIGLFVVVPIVFIVILGFYLIHSRKQKIRNLISAAKCNHPNAVNPENTIRHPLDREILSNGVGIECEVHRQIVPIQNQIVNVEPNLQQLVLPPSHCEDMPPSYEDCIHHIQLQDYQREFTEINTDQHFVLKSNT